MKTLITLVIFFTLILNMNAQDCNSYAVKKLEIAAPDTLLLTVSNTGDNSAYLNLYVINSFPPYDTLAKQELANAVFPWEYDYTEKLETDIITVPDFGTYKVSITNGTLHCDSLKFDLNTTGTILDSNQDVFRIYPNPAKTFIKINSVNVIQFVSITNILGKRFYVLPVNNKIDIRQLPKGFYQVELYNKNLNKLSEQKLIIQ